MTQGGQWQAVFLSFLTVFLSSSLMSFVAMSLSFFLFRFPNILVVSIIWTLIASNLQWLEHMSNRCYFLPTPVTNLLSFSVCLPTSIHWDSHRPGRMDFRHRVSWISMNHRRRFSPTFRPRCSPTGPPHSPIFPAPVTSIIPPTPPPRINSRQYLQLCKHTKEMHLKKKMDSHLVHLYMLFVSLLLELE